MVIEIFHLFLSVWQLNFYTQNFYYIFYLLYVYNLQPDNILLAQKSEVFPEIRLIDFGLSRRLDGPYSQFDIVGTPEYVGKFIGKLEKIFCSFFWLGK